MTTAAKQTTISKIRAADVKAGPVDLTYNGLVYPITVNDTWGGDFVVTMPQDNSRHTGSMREVLDLVRLWNAAEAEEAAAEAAMGAQRLCIAIARVAHAIAAASPSAPGYSMSNSQDSTTMTSRVGDDYVVTEGPARNPADFRATRLLHIKAVARAILAAELSLIPGRRVAACDLLPGMRVRTNLAHPVRKVAAVAQGPDADSVEVSLVSEAGARCTLVQDNSRMWDFLSTVHQSEQAQAAIHGFQAVAEDGFQKVEAPTLDIDAQLYPSRPMPEWAKKARIIAANLLGFVRFHGWELAEMDDGNDTSEVTTDRGAMERLFNLSSAWLTFYKEVAGKRERRSVLLIPCNAEDMVSNWTIGTVAGCAECEFDRLMWDFEPVDYL